jgi:hypothetical protein
MKLWNSFIIELKLAFRGFYIYIEIFMALLILVVLVFAVPDKFENKQSEYIYLDLSSSIKENYIKGIKDKDLDGKGEVVEIKIDGEVIQAEFYESDINKIYLVGNREDVIYIADKKQKIGAVVKLGVDNNFAYEYYLQGYESQRLKNLFSIIHVENSDLLIATANNQDVRSLSTGYDELTDRENVLPSVLNFNGSLLGLFIIAGFIFLDKKEGVIKAYAVSAASVWQYLLSKAGVLMLTSVASSLVITIPIMGVQPNYLLMLGFLLTTGFFASSLGLLVASFYDDFMQSFGAIFLIMVVMIIPSISYFLPSWNPSWVKFLPSYPMIQSFKEIIIENGDANYVLLVSLGFIVAGIILFLISNKRYKKKLAS